MAGFLNNQLYTAIIDASITATDGSQMGTDNRWRFVSILFPFAGNPTEIYDVVKGYNSDLSLVDIYTHIAMVVNELNSDLGTFASLLEVGVGEDYNNLICYINNSIIADLLDIGYIKTMGPSVTLGDLTVREPHYSSGAGPAIEKFRIDALMCLSALGLSTTVKAATRAGSITLPPGMGANRSWPHTGYPANQRAYPYRRKRY